MTRQQFHPSGPRSPLAEVSQLITPGVLGFYTHVQCTEVFAQRSDATDACNVFTIMVAEERTNEAPEPAPFLNPARIRVNGLEGWSFGLRRYSVPMNELLPALTALEAGEGWRLSGDELSLGAVVPMPAQFVPPENGGPVPWNKLLKNNFWTGSHMFEWTDRAKDSFKPFFDDPRRLQELSEQIERFLPLQLAAMSDRLGNIAVQLPVTVLMARFSRLQSGDFTIEHAWHPKATPRPTRVACELEHDEIITGFSAAMPVEPSTSLPMRSGRGLYRAFVWDEETGVLLAAPGPGSFISSIALNMRIPDHEPRVFAIERADGSWEERRVGLIRASTESLVGDPQSDDNGGWTAKRMYADQAKRLMEERRFVQYRPTEGDADTRHKKALDDLRALIARYGVNGAWLWDPYLSGRDILETLFHCPYHDVDLRGLTSPDVGSTKESHKMLDGCRSNWRGLKLEFRIQKGPAGWKFHDRFLIFPPGKEGTMAWSLGTSVNSVGRDHHILQKVDNAQLVLDAFRDLWERLDTPDHLIWKKP
jgi:hypothetical protein